MTATIVPDAIAFPSVKSPRHQWPRDSERRIAACESPSKNDQTERTCNLCGLIRVTVHPPQGFPFRQWRRPKGKQFTCLHTPPCQVRE